MIGVVFLYYLIQIKYLTQCEILSHTVYRYYNHDHFFLDGCLQISLFSFSFSCVSELNLPHVIGAASQIVHKISNDDDDDDDYNERVTTSDNEVSLSLIMICYRTIC